MAKKKDDGSVLLNEESVVKAQEYLTNNKRNITYIGVAIAVLAIAVYYYVSNAQQQELEARESMWEAEYFVSVDSFHLAINGNNGQVASLEEIVDEYGGTDAANIASYDLGVSYLNTGQFDAAIEHFENTSFDDIILLSMAIGACGDAYSELGQHEDAAEKYVEAADASPNNYSSPMYLMKAGLTYEKLGQKAEAAKVYKKIKDDYSASSYAQNIEKYIARAQ